MTVHLVYPVGHLNQAPGCIGAAILRDVPHGCQVEVHDWESRDLIRPDRGDVLVGHAHPRRNTTFRRSLDGEWDRRILLMPFNADPLQVAWLEPIVRQVDRFLAISGPGWRESLPMTPFRHWAPIMRFIDMGVESDLFPFVHEGRQSVGRTVLYLGSSHPAKNVDYLSRLAELMPSYRFSAIGVHRNLKGVRCLPRMDKDSQEFLAEALKHDLIISPSRADANPTTMLEGMALGLIPIATASSGWRRSQGVFQIAFGDASSASREIESIRTALDGTAAKLRWENRHRVERELSLRALSGRIWSEVLGQEGSSEIEPIALRDRISLKVAAWVGYGGSLSRVGARVRQGGRMELEILKRASAYFARENILPKQ